MAEEKEKILTAYIISHQQKCYRLAFSYVQEQQAALDVVQNAVVKALEHIHTLREISYIRTWFYRILVNESINYINSQKRETQRQERYIAQNLETITNLETKIDTIQQEIYTAVMQLSPELKTVILLRFYEDMKLSEIAQVTGESLSKVKYRLYRALSQLKKQCQYEEVNI